MPPSSSPDDAANDRELGVLPRVATTVVGLPLVLGAVWLGSPWLLVLAIVAVVVGLREFHRLAQGAGAQPSLVFMVALGVSLLLNGAWQWHREGIILGGGLLGLLAWQTLRASLSRAAYPANPATSALASVASGWAFSLAGPVYLGWTLAHGLLVRDVPGGREWLLLVLATVFATDTAAFLVGKALGSHPMAPAVSPAKTWEGAAAGLGAGVVAASVLTPLFGLPAPWWQAIVLGASMSLAAQVGDLAESLLKRAASVKASSVVLPGHGGILDRLDSIIFGLVAGYYLIRWVLQ